MERTFIMTENFDENWKSLGLNDKELKKLQEELMNNPDAGDLMRGTGGIRKYRFALDGRGKSGGSRVCYLDIPDVGKMYLLIAYAKNEKENLTMKERNELKKTTNILKSIAKGGTS